MRNKKQHIREVFALNVAETENTNKTSKSPTIDITS